MEFMLFTFPNLNQWSSPLLFFVLQGLVFACLFIVRWVNKKNISDLLLGMLLLILCYHRTTYTIGFMDWYDTYRFTKINYYLIHFGFAVGPLLYFYVKSITTASFSFKRSDVWHFVPQAIYLMYRVFIYIYDVQQAGFSDTQNGVLMEGLNNQFVAPFYGLYLNVHRLLYLTFTVQVFYNYRKRIFQYFSNAYKLELNWVRNFLAIYVLLFFYSISEDVISMSITELHWTQRWWYHLVASLAIIYISVKGYFTNVQPLKDVEFNRTATTYEPAGQITQKESKPSASKYSELMQSITNHMLDIKPYLDPDISLKSLAKLLKITPSQLSETINTGFGMNFNDYVNTYRVEAVKLKIQSGDHKVLSLVAIAYDCGFNSKATFNRVFKKLSGSSPTQYANSLEVKK